ncbi:MAG: ATP-dependent RecD-like DNA helicase [Desulfobacteraceae bacterium]|nr:MAG: ATP-dependent RecD-like DNA helicase [Desulfobacteraceae bacterium]
MQDHVQSTLEGQIERINFRNKDTHFMIAKFRPSDRAGLITVLGHIPEPKPGETLRLNGTWQNHPRFGQQFAVSHFEILLPAGVEEIRRYLSSGLIKGIGPKMAERVLQHFKEETLKVIEQEPERMTQVRGIGPKTARTISAAWQAHHQVRALMAFLQAKGIKPAYAARIYKQYGADALEIVRHDPYRLAADIPRIGFYIADALVRQSDLPVDECERAQACLRHLLEEACDDGHVCVSREDLLERCCSAFQLDYHAVREALDHLAAQGCITLCSRAPDSPVYLAPLYAAENEISRRIRAMLEIPVPPAPMDAGEIMAAVVRRMAIALSEAQLAILESVFHHRCVVITGGPGTGKTTLIRAIAAVFEAAGRNYLLAAPTGRAARRMAEVTGRPAATLHKMLGYNLSEGHFERDQDDPLDTQALIVDEASMVDAVLMGHLIKALPLQANLILVGDVFQLPSVGPGNVLADIIASEAVRTFGLEEIFRQAAQSPIIVNAHKVRQGELPDLAPMAPGDPLMPFTFIEQGSLEEIARTIIELCTHRIPEQLGLDAMRHVQVLTPMHKGTVGTLHLNPLLQAALNPGAAESSSLGGRFHWGDKVMHLRNNYQKEVFNGEIGTICDVDAGEKRLLVEYEGRTVAYDEADLDELALAYAISVHKSQGSEYPVIILPVVTQHYVMLQRNLLYTALTRARDMVILIGSAKAVRVAVQADQPRRRQSWLAWRLCDAVRPPAG